jgi:NMD protein affecting ribosome stability and mRNA decay
MGKKIKRLVKCLLCGTRYDALLHKACPSCMKVGKRVW